MSRYCSGSFVYPDPFKEEAAFIACLRQKVLELRPRMLLPTHDESVVIMRHRSEFPKELMIPYENAELLLRLADKSASTEIARKSGVPVPEVYRSSEEVKGYPVVFKTVMGNSAKSVFFPKSPLELAALMEQYKDERTLLEEWVGGTDYSVDVVRWEGFFKASTYRAVVTKTAGGGTTTQREIVSMPQLERYAGMLLDAVDYHGVCGLDFRYDSTSGRCAYIETNARFTGGIATPITAGFDIPWVLYRLATEGRYDAPIHVKTGTRTKWILGDIITMVGRVLSMRWNFREMRQVFSFSGFDAFDDYYADDRKAIIGELSYYFAKLVKNRKLNP